jgi:RimJ/RimL family protein N-acetyltransferase
MEKQTGKEIAKGLVLRLPTMDDVETAMEFVNTLVEEDAPILMDSKNTREEEERWLEENLYGIAEGARLLYFVEEKSTGKIVAAFNVNKGKHRKRFNGEFGIAVAAGFRGKGLGTKLGRFAVKEARKLGIKTLHLTTFETNKPAISLYKKLGFVREGLLRKRIFYRGKLIGEISMSRQV